MLAPHDPAWKAKFDAETKLVRSALGPALIAIHHIGRTAISGILAKPVIDMLVEAADVEVMDDSTPSPEALEYEAKGEFGIPGRRYFRKDNASGVREFHLHAFAAASREVNRHLAFRDYLLGHPDVGLEYSQLKLELSGRHSSDIAAYTDAKAPFIQSVERKALASRRSAQLGVPASRET